MSSVTALYLDVNISCVLFLLLIFFKAGSNAPHNAQRLFRLVVLSNMVLFFLDQLWILIDSHTLQVPVFFNTLVNALYYVVSGLVGFSWFLYSETKQQSRLIKRPRNVLLCSIPLLILTALVLVSMKTGWLFYVDKSNKYYRGEWYMLELAIAYGYTLFTSAKAFFLSFTADSFSRRAQYRMLSLYVVPAALAGFVQLLEPGLPILCVGNTLLLLFVYIKQQDQQISLDSLTGLNNRSHMLDVLSGLCARWDKSDHLYFLMIDVDYFKSINDTYGHMEGDKALQYIARALTRGCRNNNHFLARYGGDEFCIICKLDGLEDLAKLCNQLNAAVAEANKKVPYTLQISIGCAEYHPGLEGNQDFISQADDALYNVKQSRVKPEQAEPAVQ